MMIREVSAGGHGSSARWLAVTDEFDLNTFVFFFFHCTCMHFLISWSRFMQEQFFIIKVHILNDE